MFMQMVPRNLLTAHESFFPLAKHYIRQLKFTGLLPLIYLPVYVLFFKAKFYSKHIHEPNNLLWFPFVEKSCNDLQIQ